MPARSETAALPALFLPCGQGVEPLLADELKRLPALAGTTIEPWRGGVVVHADTVDQVPLLAMHCNLESRLAQRVLWPVAFGEYRNEHDLYALARTVDWSAWITPRETLKVDVTAARSPLQSLNFAALRIKDAVCDALREATGERPSVDTRRPDIPLLLHVDATDATLYVDTSGEALFKRGWRDDKGEAPLKETLAAAMLAAAGCRAAPKTARCSTPAAVPAPSQSRRRRSPAASHRGCSAASPSSAWRRSARCCRSGSRSSRRPRRGCMRPRCRCSPATCRSA